MPKELLWFAMLVLVLWHLAKLLSTNPRNYRFSLI
jgi:hypothetical protein